MKPVEPNIRNVLNHFSACGELLSYSQIKTGHINDTYKIVAKGGTFLLQRISSAAFKNPIAVMENIIGVTHFLNLKLQENGEDPLIGCLNLIQSDTGDFYYFDEHNDCWRVYLYIDGQTFDSPESPEQFGKAGEAFGRFQCLLSEYPSETLYEVIPHFHDTPKRFRDLERAVERNLSGRKENAKEILEDAYARKDKISKIVDGLADGSIPLRITHNDTKLNNVMFDLSGTRALCVLDLDTIMPGSALYDFGDAIRFGANTCGEDEKDLSKIHFDLEMFKAYAKGFIRGANGTLTEQEIRLFPYAGWLLTYECGIRFLTDYLNGDTYFHTDYPEHNLVRALDQFALLKDMEAKEKEAQDFIESLLK